MTILLIIFWALAGSHPVARITSDHSHISLTGWGALFLIFLMCDAYAAATKS